MELRAKIASIVNHLFMINPVRNCNESIVIGILGQYTGSVGPADRLLLSILERIDKEQSLNLISSSETWNAFKNNWSFFHVEAASSSLQSPFSIISPDVTLRNVLEFDPEVSSGPEEEVDGNHSVVDQIHGDYATYDPTFWLPVIAYCLEKVEHPSELTFLVESSAIGYALVCLSSSQETVRRMATSIVSHWRNLCEVLPLRVLTDTRHTI